MKCDLKCGSKNASLEVNNRSQNINMIICLDQISEYLSRTSRILRIWENVWLTHGQNVSSCRVFLKVGDHSVYICRVGTVEE